MGLGRKLVLIIVGLFTTIYVTGILSSLGFGIIAPFIGFMLGLLVPLVVHLLSLPRLQRPFTGQIGLAKFLGLLQVVALLAILFSPSTLRIPTGDVNATANSADTFSSMLPFLKYLQSKYHVQIANDSQTLERDLNIPGHKTYFLVGPDEGNPLNNFDSALVGSKYAQGDLSLFISEGNRTNNPFLQSYLLASVKGDAIIDKNSPFINQQVFPVTAHISTTVMAGVIDIASPIIDLSQFVTFPGGQVRQVGSNMRSIADSSPASIEAYNGFTVANTTPAVRSVIQTSETNKTRALLISDSSPFSTLYGRAFPSVGVNETTFAISLADWTTNNDSNSTVIFDNYHYQTVQAINNKGTSFNLPVGRLFAGALALLLSTTNNSYDSFLAASRPFILGLALLTTWSIYTGLVKKYATDKRGRDDEPLPKIEKVILSESETRQRFLSTSRDKGFYVASLQQLYQILDKIIEREFGAPIAKISRQQLEQRLGPNQLADAERLLLQLSKIDRFANHQTRFMYPPVLLWKHTAAKLTSQTEQFLNKLGITMTDESSSRKGLDYRTRRT